MIRPIEMPRERTSKSLNHMNVSSLRSENKLAKSGEAKSNVKSPLAVLLMATMLSGGFVGLSASDASAQNFLQRLFTPKEKRLEELKAREAQAKRKTAVKYKVSAPKIFTYKPDAWKTVSLASLAKVTTAAVQSSEATEVTSDLEGQIREAEKPLPVLTAFDKARPALKELRFKALPEVGEALEAYYREHPDFLWSTDGEINPKALAALEALEDADRFGLDPEDYSVGLLKPVSLIPISGSDADEAPVDPRAAAAMAFEMELSAAVLTYILDAERGRIDPNRLSEYHDLPRAEVDLVASLRDVQASTDVKVAMKAHQPQDDVFSELQSELAKLRAEDEEEDAIVIAPGTFLKVGRSSPEVKNIVAAIRKNGSDALREKHMKLLVSYTGENLYSQEIANLVKGFQKENKLAADGIVGKNTIRAMVGETNAAKIAKIELAMERRRWLPDELGERRVFINQPAFTATFYEGSSLPLSMRVVVGKKSNQTNFFYDNVEIVEYNPYWGVPYSIIVNEMIPKLAANPYYLDQAGYEVTTPSGRKVSSANVNWYAVASRQQSINVRQYPGAKNALGVVKILFPNKHHIYMHDTPAKSLFNKDTRAYSHGCVRLHDPKAMAAAVLGKSKDYVSQQIAKGKNRQERVEGDLPVYVSYFTAWPNDAGQVEYFADVYDRDRHLLKALKKTDDSRASARS
ncbi:murein L,D-transpeptidase [Roseibium sp. TrichSKD4]|uniref:L,D-transpeptidase family protein n=1 Tax=Roseibium sp. TrichSKD4 TaxID=744980 RepID=UPI0002D5C7C0|nr:L,D-transpeptidase family protein [Roseibium sp. TrichSKD4]